MTPEQMEENARKFLAKLLAETKGMQNAFYQDIELGSEIGLDEETTQAVVDYLDGLGLIERRTMGGHVTITSAGISALKPKQSSPAAGINIVHVGQMHNSQLQQGTSQSTQTQVKKGVDQNELKALVAQLTSEFSKANIPADKREDFEATIQTLEAQARVSKPKAEIVKPVLHQLVDFATIFGADLAAATLHAYMLTHGWLS